MAFESEARKERAYYDSLSVADLHALIRERRFGRTGMFWQSLRERTTLLVSGWTLLELLERRSVNRETRAQAAGVLLHLANCMIGRRRRWPTMATRSLNLACANCAAWSMRASGR